MAATMPLNATFGAEATAKVARTSSSSAETQKLSVDQYPFLTINPDKAAASYSESNDAVGVSVVLGKREINWMRSNNASPTMIEETYGTLIKRGDSASKCFISKSEGENTVVVLWVNGVPYKDPLTNKSMFTINTGATVAPDAGRYSRAVKNALKPSVAALQ